ncbi:replicative DNA helicase [Listeria newyorkensis]|uniref:replicative DNA helicase n=1 Tax=Listeria newyorkensis TaxID=1497681 RepID=UPI00051DEBD5|nr:replicative DNA helicase [Listeria newyorkensis]KGL44094.1 hypothetical protein EP58_06495 [Listeria newyorkensis]SQC57457.1 Replicative DNA helicase [Listeria newyorkensis]
MSIQVKIEAETSVLGAVFLQPDLIHSIALLPEHFTDAKNRQLYTVMQALKNEGIVIDPVTMFSKLTNAEALKYMTDLAGSCPTAAHYQYYEKIVLDEYEKMIVMQAAKKFIETKDEQSMGELVEKAREVRSYDVKDQTTQNEDMLEIYNSMYEYQGPLNGELSSGYPALDNVVGGMKASDLIIIAGRPSMGKTAFAVNVAINIAKNAAADKKVNPTGGLKQVDVFSLEMPRKSLLQRMISSIGNVRSEVWHDPYHVLDTVKGNIIQAQGVISGLDLHIDDNSSVGVSDIERRIREVRASNKVSKHVIVIDYLGLMKLPEKERHDLSIGKLTGGLKLLCKKYNVTIILLSQLSRGVEQRQDKRPMLSDLRDSGSIEQDADVVMLLYRDDYYNRDTDAEGLVEVIVAKNRNGAIGTVQLAFVKEHSKFLNLELRLAEAK